MGGLSERPTNSTGFNHGLVLQADVFIPRLDPITILQASRGNFVVDPNRLGVCCAWYPVSRKGTAHLEEHARVRAPPLWGPRRREGAAPDATLIAPTWQRADVLQDAIGCAPGQSFQNLGILIAVNKPDDATAQIVEAARDREWRVVCLLHSERPDRVRLMNAAPDSARHFGLSSHDDLTGRNDLQRQVEPPDATPDATAICTAILQDFGNRHRFDKSRADEGSVETRLMDRMFAWPKGAPFFARARCRLLNVALRQPESAFFGWCADGLSLLVGG